MDHIDLSEIDPLKWAETRRRLAAVQEYVSLPFPGVADRERLAATLDLGAHQFANLVKAWQASREVSALSPGARRPDLWSRSRRGGVDPVARELARSEIAGAAPGAKLDRLCASVAAACVAAGVEPPSRGTVWLLAREARRAGGPDLETSGVVVGRAFLRLPVDVGTGVVLPEIALAVDMPSTRILAATAPGPSPPDARQLAEAIGAASVDTPLQVDVDERDVDRLAGLLPDSSSIGSIPSARASSMLTRALGGRIGRLDLSCRRPSVRPAALMQSGRDRAPGLADAAAALSFACTRHNADLDLAA